MKNKKVAIVIPVYTEELSKYEEFTFRNNLKIFDEREVFLLGPKRVENHLHFLKDKTKNIQIKVIDDKFFESLETYSRLLISSFYYNMFKDYEFTLICQNDAIVFKDDLDFWMESDYDFIGAPTFLFNSSSIKDLKKSLNGGLSLRKTKSCLRVLEYTTSFRSRLKIYLERKNWDIKNIYKNLTDGFIFNYYFPHFKPILNEDTYWSGLIPELFPWYKIPDFSEVRYFAFEVNARLLYILNNEVLPMGIHAWWRYDEEFSRMLMLKNNPKISITEEKEKP